MAEINNTQWLEEYLKMWTPKERMGRIHKVTTFDPTYHCYPEGVYLLDDDCRAHTAIYVVDKNHNVHIIYDGMAWDLLARAVEKGLLEISLKLSEGDKGLVAVLERMLTAQNTCCAGLQAKLKKIGDELERIADAVEGGAKPKPKPDPEPEPEPEPEKKTLFLAEPDRHKVTKDKKVYTSVITSIVKDVPEQPWTITDDFATYPSWATVSTDKAHVYITTDGSKPGKGTNDPWSTGEDDNPDGDFDVCDYGTHSFKLSIPDHGTLTLHGSADATELTGEVGVTTFAFIYDKETGKKKEIPDVSNPSLSVVIFDLDGPSAELEGDKIIVTWHKGDPTEFFVNVGRSENCGMHSGFYVKVVLDN
jgi:hypothetical protein